MDTTKGTSQTSKAINTNATTSEQDIYFTKFVSPTIANTSISANTWNYSWAADQDNVNANFPVSGSGKTIYINCFVWDKIAQSKVGIILDGASNSDYQEPSAVSDEQAMYGQFGGSAVSSGITAGRCVIVFEVWCKLTMNSATSRLLHYWYDGLTENTTNGTSVSNHASFLETPQSITFQSGVAIVVPTQTTTVSDARARLAAKVRKPAAQTITTSDSVVISRKTKVRTSGTEFIAFVDSGKRLAAKKRAVTTETITVAEPSPPAIIHAKNVSRGPATQTVAVSDTAAVTRRNKQRKPATQTVAVTDLLDQLTHPKKSIKKITENISIIESAVRKTAKKRIIIQI